jgi:5-methyltetrahydropteroyltriglutamate--homocysteine methyltransferase
MTASVTTAVLGLPRIGPDRELKHAVEAYWRGELSDHELQRLAAAIRRASLDRVAAAGVDVVPVNDFSLYDHVLDAALMVGAVPERVARLGLPPLRELFALARGRDDVRPLEMTKWFDTNYHYLVPELEPGAVFSPDAGKAVGELTHALAWGAARPRPVLLGPVTFLTLAKPARLDLLDPLLEAYEAVLEQLAAAGAEEVQIDEPCLVADPPEAVLGAVERAWTRLAGGSHGLDLALATYFGGLGDALERVLRLPVAEVHLDLVRAPEQLERTVAAAGPRTRLSLGVVDGRNVWAADLEAIVRRVEPVVERLGADRVRIAPSCSLLHVPYAAARERALDPDLRSWLAFGDEKLAELRTIKAALGADPARRRDLLGPSRRAHRSRGASSRVHDPAVAARLAALGPADLARRSPHAERAPKQAERLGLPELPTTTIGSFPQTPAIRRARRSHAAGEIDDATYRHFLEDEIRTTIARQEEAGLDVLVHGEPERNDMVQHFAERLGGFAVTEHGWVQSYGSRCVKPPVLYGDVVRDAPMTVDWWRFAQDCSQRPVKAMLTGPVTLLQWSFVRDDQPREQTCRQLALAVRDEALDLERAGAAVIQIDEAALREGVPLRRGERDAYLRWAIDCFRLAAGGLGDATQVHAHMCYSEFSEIAQDIARMDADVISIEASRSRMDLLDAFAAYPNQIGPGVYDIHAPRVPAVDEIEALLASAERRIGRDRLWVNPDCGLKTRSWAEVVPALEHLVAAARRRRAATPAAG